MPTIQWKQYCVYYKVKRDWYLALDTVDLEIGSGKLALITGSSGCGKTTLLRSVMGFAKQSSGQLLLDGQDIANIQPGKQNIGYVSQEYSLYPSMTVYETIAYPLKICQTPLRELDNRVRTAADLVGLGNLLTRKPRQLSGGQQQRLALARALVKRPSLLLLDEPFSNLPEATKTELYEAVDRYHQTSKATVLFVTHDLDEALPLADMVIEMEEGAVMKVIELQPARTKKSAECGKEEER